MKKNANKFTSNYKTHFKIKCIDFQTHKNQNNTILHLINLLNSLS